MKKKGQEKMHWAANFIYEVGILRQTPRSGLWFLGTGQQSVAEHVLRTTLIGYALSKLEPKADADKLLRMCLMHDLGEGRTSDLNYVHQKYGRLAEVQAVEDLAATLPFGKEIKDLHTEAHEKKTLEAKLAKDADNLEWIATLREEEVKGNIKAGSWLKSAVKRLKTPAGKKIGEMLLSMHPDAWWYEENDSWFVARAEKDRRWNKVR